MNVIIIILIIIAIPLIGAAFLKNESALSRDIVIRRPSQDVFNYVRLLRNHNHFSKWNMADPNMKITYRGTDGAVGSVMAWDSADKNVGKGEQEIKAIAEGRRIDFELRFEKPFKGLAFSHMITEPLPDGQARVTWFFGGPRNYMMKLMSLLLNLDKVLGKDLQTSLNNLKTVLESNRS